MQTKKVPKWLSNTTDVKDTNPRLDGQGTTGSIEYKIVKSIAVRCYHAAIGRLYENGLREPRTNFRFAHF